ncbi:NAD-P-binding protein, partial [Crucibulum laeve]
VTGASSGFGRAVTETVLEKGDIVSATLRNPSALEDLSSITSSEKLLVIKCDVTQSTDISTAFEETIKKFGRCDVVFNNAGYGIVGEVEGTPDDAARKLFETNFWGAANISRESIRVFRECNPKGDGGRLLTMSSGAGFKGVAGGGYYAASKHALQGLTDSLAKEMNPAWNIKISILEPGAFKTRAHRENNVTFPPHPAYTDPDLPSQKLRRNFEVRTRKGDVHRAAERIFEFAGLEYPPLHWPIGHDAIAGVRKQINDVTEQVNAYEFWSDGLTFDAV